VADPEVDVPYLNPVELEAFEHAGQLPGALGPMR